MNIVRKSTNPFFPDMYSVDTTVKESTYSGECHLYVTAVDHQAGRGEDRRVHPREVALRVLQEGPEALAVRLRAVRGGVLEPTK